MDAEEAAVAILAKEDVDVFATTVRTATADATVNCCRNSTEHGWNDCPLRLPHQQQNETQHANAIQVSSSDEYISHAWCTTTENADSEDFQVVVGDGAEHPPRNDEMYEHVTNTKVLEDVAFPAMMEIGTGTTPGDTAVFIDTAASNHTVTAESRLSTHHVVNKIKLQCVYKRVMRPVKRNIERYALVSYSK